MNAGCGHVECAVQVNRPYCRPFRWFHFGESPITQYARVINDNVHAAERLDSFFDYGCSSFRSCNGIVVRNRFSTQCFDLFDHCVRGCLRPSCSIPGTAQIVNHQLSSALCKFKGVDPAQARTRTGHDCHLAVEADFIRSSSVPGPAVELLSRNSR